MNRKRSRKGILHFFFQNFINIKKIKHNSRNTIVGAVFAGRFNRSVKDLLKKLVFEKGENDWIDVLPTITKQYNNRAHTSTKLAPIQASLKKNEGFVYKSLLYRRKKMKPKFKILDLVRVAELKKTCSKGDTTNWSYKLKEIAEINTDTIPTYHIDHLPERYNVALLKKTESTMKRNDNVMKKF